MSADSPMGEMFPYLNIFYDEFISGTARSMGSLYGLDGRLIISKSFAFSPEKHPRRTSSPNVLLNVFLSLGVRACMMPKHNVDIYKL